MKFLFILFIGFVFKSHAGDQITSAEILAGKHLSEFSVKKWGAVGDGQTDDHASIQRAVDSQKSSGKVILYFPPGDFKVSQVIKISGADSSGFGKFNFLVVGAGHKKTKVFSADKNKDTFYIESGSNAYYAEGVVKDLTIGPIRKKDQDTGWALSAKRLKGSKLNIYVEGSKCSLRSTEEGGRVSKMAYYHAEKRFEENIGLPGCALLLD